MADSVICQNAHGGLLPFVRSKSVSVFSRWIRVKCSCKFIGPFEPFLIPSSLFLINQHQLAPISLAQGKKVPTFLAHTIEFGGNRGLIERFIPRKVACPTEVHRQPFQLQVRVRVLFYSIRYKNKILQFLYFQPQ